MVCSSRSLLAFIFGAAVVSGVNFALAQAQDAKPSASVQKITTKSPKPSIYDKTADTQIQIAKAGERARREHKRILVMFGGDWCGWCHKLHELFASNDEIRKVLSYEYELVMVDTTAPGAEALLRTCQAGLSKEDLAKGVGYPFLSVLDPDGKVVKAQRTDPLETGDHHDPVRVRDFLTAWKVVPRNASELLRQALADGSSHEKRIFLAFGAPWCGWCHRLENWMADPANADILDREFVVVHIDTERMTGGQEMLTRYRPGGGGGIPWFAVLDSNGKALGTSDGPRGNIGYPYKAHEIDHFMDLITKGARRITPVQREILRQSLRTAAERIESESKRTATD